MWSVQDWAQLVSTLAIGLWARVAQVQFTVMGLFWDISDYLKLNLRQNPGYLNFFVAQSQFVKMVLKNTFVRGTRVGSAVDQ